MTFENFETDQPDTADASVLFQNKNIDKKISALKHWKWKVNYFGSVSQIDSWKAMYDDDVKTNRSFTRIQNGWKWSGKKTDNDYGHVR